MKYQRRNEPPIEAISVEELLDLTEQEQMPLWVAEAASKGRLRLMRSHVEIVGGSFAATAMRTDMLCFDENQPEGNQIFYLSAVQFRRFTPVESTS
jgi:hypothetical protein